MDSRVIAGKVAETEARVSDGLAELARLHGAPLPPRIDLTTHRDPSLRMLRKLEAMDAAVTAILATIRTETKEKRHARAG
jgi:hypothetical protein